MPKKKNTIERRCACGNPLPTKGHGRIWCDACNRRHATERTQRWRGTRNPGSQIARNLPATHNAREYHRWYGRLVRRPRHALDYWQARDRAKAAKNDLYCADCMSRLNDQRCWCNLP